jgi:hypothetical protein
MEVNRTGSELCPAVGFGISSVEQSGSATKVLVYLVFILQTVSKGRPQAYGIQHTKDAWYLWVSHMQLSWASEVQYI